MSGRAYSSEGHCDAAENEATCPIRTYRRNQEEPWRMDFGRRFTPRRLSIPQSDFRIAAYFNQAVRAHSSPMVRRNRIGPDGIQYTHYAPDEANPHLPSHKKFASGAAIAGPHAPGKYCALSWH